MDPLNDLCNLCNKTVHIRDNAIVCDLCNSWIHIRCNWLDKNDYKTFQENPNKSFFCLQCLKDIIPYSKLNDNEFDLRSAKGVNFRFIPQISSDVQSPIKQLMYDRLNNWINNLNSELLDDDDTMSNETQCNYFSIDEFKDLSNVSDETFSILHLNIHSIQLHIDEFRTFLSSLNYKFDIIALSETKLQDDLVAHILISGYRNSIHTFTEASKGGGGVSMFLLILITNQETILNFSKAK